MWKGSRNVGNSILKSKGLDNSTQICISVLGSKLDTDIHKNICRLAFDGKMVHSFTEKEYQSVELPKLKIYKDKKKEGIVERCVNDYEASPIFVHSWKFAIDKS